MTNKPIITLPWEKSVLWQLLSSRQGADAEEVKATVTLCLRAANEILDKSETAPKDFTLHDSDHSLRVAENMSKIIPQETQNELSDYELAFLLLSAYLHDIGMHPDRSRITAHYEYLLTASEGLLTEREVLEFQEWLDRQAEAVAPPLSPANPRVDHLRKARELVTYYCRARHNDWSASWIKDNLAPYPLAQYVAWIDDLVVLCKSHHEGYKDLVGDKFDPRLVGADVVHLRYLALVLRVADIVDVDPERTPGIILRHRHVADENVIYWYKDQQLRLNISNVEIGAYARPKDAKLHKAIEETIDGINGELETCFLVSVEKNLASLPSSVYRKLPHSWTLPRACVRNIAPRDGAYEYVNGAFRPDTNKLLQLLSGVELYGSELAATRELLQNAFDAVQIQIGLERIGHSNPLDPRYLAHLREVHEVVLSLDVIAGEAWITCTDTGVGMSKRIIEGYLLVSGSRRPPETLELTRRCNRAGFSLETTAEFGIGVLSYFMLADRLIIRTVRSRESSMGAPEFSGWRFETEGVGSFGELRRDVSFARGTEVRLQIRPDVVNQGPEVFWGKLRRYLQGTLRRTPCRFILKSSVPEAAEWRVGPGWTMSDESLRGEIREQLRQSRYDDQVPSELLPVRVRDVMRAEESHFENLRHLISESMKLVEECGDLPEEMGYYRIRVPYFDLHRGICGGFLHVNSDSPGTSVIERMGRGFCFVPMGSNIHSWKGMALGRSGFDLAHDPRFGHVLFERQRGVVEIDWTSSDAGKLAINRSQIEASEKVEKTLSWLQQRTSKLGSELVLEHAPSPYALLNANLFKTQLPDSSPTEWLQVTQDEKVEWKPVRFPATTSMPFIYVEPEPLEWNGQDVSVLRCVSEYDDAEHYKGPTFISMRTPPDRVCTFGRYRFGLAPVWFNRRIVRASENAGMTSRFAPEWKFLCGVHFARYTSDDSADVWNADNRLVKAVGPTLWQWCSERFARTHDPLQFRREILSDPGLAAGWLFWCLARSHSKIWDGTLDRDPHFMETIWGMFGEVVDDSNWNGEVLHWVEDTGGDARLRIVTSKKWRAIYPGKIDSNKQIESLLPDPGIEWRLTTSRQRNQSPSGRWHTSPTG